MSGFNDVATKFPQLLETWHETKNVVDIRQITTGYKDKLWWKCSLGHEYQNTIQAQILVRICPVCSGYQVQPGVNDLKSMYPTIAEEWDEERNQMSAEAVSYGSGKMAVWRCPKGHYYECTVTNRTCNGRGCPYCVNKKVLAGFNDLKSQAPYLLTIWDGEGNPNPETVYWRSRKLYRWNCLRCGRKYERSVISVVLGHRCSYCKN